MKFGMQKGNISILVRGDPPSLYLALFLMAKIQTNSVKNKNTPTRGPDSDLSEVISKKLSFILLLLLAVLFPLTQNFSITNLVKHSHEVFSMTSKNMKFYEITKLRY